MLLWEYIIIQDNLRRKQICRQLLTTRKTKTGILASLDGLFGNVNICCVKFLFIWPFFKTLKKRIFIVQLSFKFQCAVLDSVKNVTSFLFNIFSVYLLWQTESYNDTSKGGKLLYLLEEAMCTNEVHTYIYIYDFAGLFFTLTITLRSLLSVLFY